MEKLKDADIKRVKALGFLINRGTSDFSGRIVPAGSIFTAKELSAVAEIADKFGNGKIAMTNRLSAEVIGIPYENIDDAIAYAKSHNLFFGGTGAKIRPVIACKGTTCVYGNYDTQALAKEIYEKYYLGWSNVKLPHKFKISIGGCPNSCMKPSLNDFGVEGHRIPKYNKDLCHGCKVCQVEKNCPSKAAHVVDGKCEINEKCKECGVCSTGKCPFKAFAQHNEVMYQIYVGGTFGKNVRFATKLSHMVTKEEIFPLLEKTMLWFKENGYQKERLGNTIDRIGVDKLEEALFSDDLLNRKEEILEKEILERP